MEFDSNQIKSFAKDVLGCTCPDEVFLAIKLQKKVQLEHGLIADLAIRLSDRLLIIIINKDNINKKFVDETLPKLITHGRFWRDTEELNRFRLVIFTTAKKKNEKRLKKNLKR
jgi:hypothetical protein